MDQYLDRIRGLVAPRFFVKKNINKAVTSFSESLHCSETDPDILILGCGSSLGRGIDKIEQRVLKKAIKVDLIPHENVDIAADIHELPFNDTQFDGVIIQNVLEHVRFPKTVVDEIYRTLKPGGIVFSTTPFIQIFHAIPDDYHRFTIPAQIDLFNKFETLETGVSVGPSDSAVHILSYYTALLFSFNQTYLFRVLLLFFSWLFCPLKLMDFFIINHKNSYLLAREIYYIGKK